MSMTVVGRRNLRSVLEHQVQTQPDTEFLIFEDLNGQTSTLTYGEFDGTVNRTANALLQLGVRKGDKVNLHLWNRPEFLFFWFAIGKIGAVMVPTNPLSPPDELRYPVHHSESIVTVTHPDLLPNVLAIRKDCPNLRHMVLVDSASSEEPSEGVLSFAALLETQSSDLESTELDQLDEAAILYTSGTTSRPKGVQVTHANYVYLSEAVSRTTGLRPEDRHLLTLPLFHGNAQYYSVMPSINVGASIALMGRFSASGFMKQARRHGCTIASLLGTPMRMILAQPEDPADRENGLRLVFYAMSVTEDQVADWQDRFGANLLQLYGMTETMGQPLANPVYGRRDNTTIGLPTLGYECRVVDDLGVDVPVGVSGHLLVSGTPGVSIMKGYFKDPENTARTIRDGWLWTGDVVEVNEDGYFRFLDRANDLIKRSGENVSALEVEIVIERHPAVADVAVVGIPDEMRDESIKAFVALKNGHSVSESDIIDFCAQRLSKFRIPESVEFVDEFPRTSTGKIRKNILKQERGVQRGGAPLAGD